MTIRIGEDQVLTVCIVTFEPIVMTFPETGEPQRVDYSPKVRRVNVLANSIEEAISKVKAAELGEIESTELVVDDIIFHSVELSKIKIDY